MAAPILNKIERVVALILFYVIFSRYSNEACAALTVDQSRTQSKVIPQINSDNAFRQIQIQSNSGQPIISLSSVAQNGSRPMLPNIQITQGPTNDWLSQPLSTVLTIFQNMLTLLLPSPPASVKTSAPSSAPIVIIPIVIAFPPGEDNEDTVTHDAQKSVVIVNDSLTATPFHAVFPIIGTEEVVGIDGDTITSDEVIQELKRRREVTSNRKPTETEQTDSIVRHIQSLVDQSVASTAKRSLVSNSTL